VGLLPLWISGSSAAPRRPSGLLGSPLQVLLWLLLMALVSVRISLPLAINIRILSINVGRSWIGNAPSPWLMLAWILSVILAIAGAWIFAGPAAVLPPFEIQRRYESRFFGPWRTDSGLVDFMCIGWPQMEHPAPEGVLLDIALFFLGLWPLSTSCAGSWVTWS